MSISLYVHIPFCIKRCIYCDFVSGVYSEERAQAYISALTKEIEEIPDDIHLSTIYIGGGTPTALPHDLLERLVTSIFDHCNFVSGYEATIEANPGTLDIGKLEVLRSSGLNRISMGVQSFNDSELSFLDRPHNAEDAAEAFSLVRKAGFSNAGIDLIYGIPGQNIDDWKANLEKAVSIEPEHISTYELTVEEGTSLHTLLHSKDSSLPDEEIIIEMYEYTIDFLTSRGYEHYEISNFAKPGFRSRHNINYWDRGAYYGVGLGAHSFIKNKRWHNTKDLHEYLQMQMSPVIHTEEITERTALSEAIMLGLRKCEGLLVESINKRYKTNILNSFRNEIQYLVEAGLVETASSTCSYETSLRLTRKGLLLSNEVIEKFLR